MKHNKIIRLLGSMTGLVLLCKLLGFVKQMVIAGSFGATMETDLVNLSYGFMGNLQYLLIQCLTTSVVTMYIHAREKGTEDAKCFAANATLVFGGIAAILSALVFFLAPWVARLIAPTYSPEQLAQLSGYLRLFAPVLVFFVLGAVSQSLLHANERFISGELAIASQSVLVIVAIWLFQGQLGVNALSVGFWVYAIFSFLYLGALARPYCRRLAGNPMKDPIIRQMLKMTLPLLAGYSLTYVNQLVNKILVSGLEIGSVTALEYGGVLNQLISTFITTFAGILFPYVIAQIARGAEQSAAELTVQSGLLMTSVFLPISIITVFCAEDIVQIAFGRGAFDAKAVHVAALALQGYAIGVVPLVLREVTCRYHYAYQDTHRPMVNAGIGILLNILLSLALCPSYGVFGVAFASSASLMVCAMLNLLTAYNKHGLRYNSALHALPFLIASGMVCGLLCQWGLSFWQNSAPLLRFTLITLTAGGADLFIVSPLLLKLIRQKKLGP